VITIFQEEGADARRLWRQLPSCAIDVNSRHGVLIVRRHCSSNCREKRIEKSTKIQICR